MSAPAASAAASSPDSPVAPARAAWRELAGRLVREKPLGAAGAIVFALFLLCGLLAGALAPYGINETHLAHRLEPPSLTFLLGTDQLGRDVFSRVLHGARLSMIVALLAAGFSTVISVVVVLLTSYFGGWVDQLTQRFVDAWMVFPGLVLLIGAISIVGPGLGQIVVILSLLYGIAGSRVVRGAALGVQWQTCTLAARSLGARPLYVLWRHVLPNVMPVVLVLFTTRLGAVILAEAGLSFLGLGVPPPAPTWGGMLSGDGRTYMYVGPWLAIAPGLSLTAVVFAVNVFGDALRDLLDPKMRGIR